MSAAIRSCPAALAAASILIASAPHAQERALRPTEVLHRAIVALSEADRSKQADTVKPLLQLASRDHLSPAEEMALGDLYFMAFDPRGSDAIFAKYLDRTDAVGRMAWIRHQQVQFRAFDRHDETERALPEFRRRFALTADDLTYDSVMVGNQAGRYKDAGDHAKVVSLVLEAVKPLPLDVPYRAFRLLGAYYPSFAAVGREAEARALLEAHQAALRKRVAGAGPDVLRLSAIRLQRPAHVPGRLHADWDTGIADDDPGFDRDRFNTGVALDRIDEITGMLKGGPGR